MLTRTKYSGKSPLVVGAAVAAAALMALLPLAGCKTEVEAAPAPTEKVTLRITPDSGGADTANPLEVTITTVPEGASVTYSLDGGEYTAYEGPIRISGPASLRAKATKGGYIDSDEAAATYTQREYTITYRDAGGKEFGGTADNPATFTMASGGVTLAPATWTGHDFEGWFTDEQCTTRAESPAIPAGSHGDKTFYAKWTPYDLGSGTGGPAATAPDVADGHSEKPFAITMDESGRLHADAQGVVWYLDGEPMKKEWVGSNNSYCTPVLSELSIGTYLVMAQSRGGNTSNPWQSAYYELEVTK